MIEEVIYNFFLDLQKAYENLYGERCLEILVGYGIGPRKERILRIYLEHLLMVAKTGRYYGTPLKGYWGIVQVDPLSPTIFNMELDVGIQNWVTLVSGEEAAPEGLGQAVQWLAALF